MKKALSLILPPCVLLLGACAGEATKPGANGGGNDAKPTIVTAFYGLEYTAKQIAGDTANVTSLTQPGQESHGLELKPSQIAEIGKADQVVYLKQFQPAVDEAVAQSGNKHVLDAATVADLLKADEAGHGHDHGDDDHDHGDDHGHDDHADDHGDDDHGDGHDDGAHGDDDHGHDDGAHGHDGHDHGDFDPHFWLDPMRMAKVGQALADELSQRFPDNKDTYQENAKQFAQEMSKIDEEYASGLTKCERKEFITTHAAFNYLAKKYNLTEIGISGINPDGEPSPARIAEVQKLAKEHGVTTIFFETLTSPAVSKAIAGDLGLKTQVLDPLEGITDNSPGKDYPSIMRANLNALKEANGCN